MYNNHYPCNTKEDVEAFIKDYGLCNVGKFLRSKQADLLVGISSLQRDYLNSLKDEADSFGNTKEKAIVQNQITRSKYEYQIENAFADLSINERMVNEFVTSECISTETANYILKAINKERHYIWGYFLLLVVFLLFATLLTIL